MTIFQMICFSVALIVSYYIGKNDAKPKSFNELNDWFAKHHKRLQRKRHKSVMNK